MTDYTELKRLAESLIELNMTNLMDWAATIEDARIGKTHTEYALAANPAAILALIAENERLQESHEQICTNYNQVSYASEERGKQIDQLKAELEHTGYDHDLLRTERDQLKAENEKLRKLAPSKDIIWCACGDGHAANSYGAGFMDANKGVCANCDAAMGKGEQS